MEVYDNIFDEIKSKVSLEEELEKAGVKLTRSGSGRMKGCCPLHNEKTPSFMLYKGENYDSYYCFGCRSGGDVIEFIKNLKCLTSYRDVVEYFSKNYVLEYSDKEKDLDDLFSDNFKKRKTTSKVIYNYGISTSKMIRNHLKSKNNTNEEFMRIQSYLKALDFSVFQNNIEMLKFNRSLICDYIKDSKKNDS